MIDRILLQIMHSRLIVFRFKYLTNYLRSLSITAAIRVIIISQGDYCLGLFFHYFRN